MHAQGVFQVHKLAVLTLGLEPIDSDLGDENKVVLDGIADLLDSHFVVHYDVSAGKFVQQVYTLGYGFGFGG